MNQNNTPTNNALDEQTSYRSSVASAGPLFVNLKNLEIKTTPEVEMVFNNYPANVRKRLVGLRELILETAKELEEIAILEKR